MEEINKKGSILLYYIMNVKHNNAHLINDALLACLTCSLQASIFPLMT